MHEYGVFIGENGDEKILKLFSENTIIEIHQKQKIVSASVNYSANASKDDYNNAIIIYLNKFHL